MPVAIWWIRRDLRLADNPALVAAARHGQVVPLYIHAPEEEGEAAPGAAARWWLHHSLAALAADLTARFGTSIAIIRAEAALPALLTAAKQWEADAIFWNRQYAPSQIRRDETVKATLRANGLRAESSNSHLLFEPWTILRPGSQEPFRVFTPFWKACQAAGIDQTTLPVPELTPVAGLDPNSFASALAALDLLPHHPDWAGGLRATWQPGEAGAWTRLERFINEGLRHYHVGRNLPGERYTSQLSPHLSFGEISPRQVVQRILSASAGVIDGDVAHFFSELGWREFGYHLLYHFPHTVREPLDPRWTSFPWPPIDQEQLVAWQRGRTGIPLVDAGMRELWHTGWMHNRTRMNAASLLVKNLLTPWQEGERWFWDTLVDADLASNVLGWQWTAGCGADAAPYFRIFNPVLQGERFDPHGDYVRRWVPELARLPDRWVHQPWSAPAEVREAAGVRLGENYPWPIVDLAASRARALEVFAQFKERALRFRG